MAKIRNIDHILNDVDADMKSESDSLKKNDEFDDIDDNYNKNKESYEIDVIREPIGTVEYFFKKINVAAIKLFRDIKIGDTIEIIGGTSIITQKISSIQINKEDVNEGHKNDSVGIIINAPVKKGCMVYKLN